MKLLKKLAVLTAAALCTNGIMPAAAADDVMTFRMTADTDTIYTDQLENEDAVVHGGVRIDNYTGLTNLRLMLKSDSPLTIENGDFTRDPVKTDKRGEPLHYMFPEHDQADYMQYSAVTGESNVVLWYAKGFVQDQIAVMGNPDTTFVDFDIRIPKGTPVGTYKL